MRYSISELRSIWKQIAGTKHEADILADFGVCSKSEAELLIDVFKGNPKPLQDEFTFSPPSHSFSEWEW